MRNIETSNEKKPIERFRKGLQLARVGAELFANEGWMGTETGPVNDKFDEYIEREGLKRARGESDVFVDAGLFVGLAVRPRQLLKGVFNPGD